MSVRGTPQEDPIGVDEVLTLLAQRRVYSLAHKVTTESPTLADRSGTAVGRGIDIEGLQKADPVSGVVIHSERLSFHSHSGTHIDAHNHWVKRQAAESERSKFNPSGIEAINPIIARGIHLDIAAGASKPLEAGELVTPEMIETVLSANNTALIDDDVVLVRTGWSRHWGDAATYMSGAPGLTLAAARYLYERGCRVLGTDQWSVDVVPAAEDENAMACHAYCLGDGLMYLLENVMLDGLSADGVVEFVFVLSVPPWHDLTAFPVAPLALV